MNFAKITGNNKGFSLAGIIVSMIVLSIMAALSLPALQGIVYENKAQNVSVLANTLINAESTYVNNNGKFSSIGSLQSAGYIAKGIGINFLGGNPDSDCIYGSIKTYDDTKICLSVNNSVQNGTAQEISYTLAVTPSQGGEPYAYYNFYKEIRHDIPGSSIINGNEIIYIDPIALSNNAGGTYGQYVGKSFYITGAICYITEDAYLNSGRGHTYKRIWDGGELSLYFIVESINGNKAILSYANNPYSQCTGSSSYSNNAGDTYSYSDWVGGAFQNPYLPQVWGTVEYAYWEGGMNYVPIEPPGYEIQIPSSYLPKLINLNQSNTLN
ncbi:MAG: type II secretion system protein [Candidatus Acidulodesulfobacterium sp.]